MWLRLCWMQEVQEGSVDNEYLNSTCHVPSKCFKSLTRLIFTTTLQGMVHGCPTFCQCPSHIPHCKLLKSGEFFCLAHNCVHRDNGPCHAVGI